MKREQWENVEIIETFGDEPVWSIEAPPEPAEPRRMTAWEGLMSRRAGLAVVLLAVGLLVGAVGGYGLGRGSGSTRVVVAASPVAATPNPDPYADSLALSDPGPCDRLAVSSTQIVATEPAEQAVVAHFPHLIISSVNTSRYDDNDQICAVDITAVDQQLVLNFSLRYFGIQDDLISTAVGSEGSQASISYSRDFGDRQYAAWVEFTNPDSAQLPALPVVQALVNDPLLARQS